MWMQSIGSIRCGVSSAKKMKASCRELTGAMIQIYRKMGLLCWAEDNTGTGLRKGLQVQACEEKKEFGGRGVGVVVKQGLWPVRMGEWGWGVGVAGTATEAEAEAGAAGWGQRRDGQSQGASGMGWRRDDSGVSMEARVGAAWRGSEDESAECLAIGEDGGGKKSDGGGAAWKDQGARGTRADRRRNQGFLSVKKKGKKFPFFPFFSIFFFFFSLFFLFFSLFFLSFFSFFSLFFFLVFLLLERERGGGVGGGAEDGGASTKGVGGSVGGYGSVGAEGVGVAGTVTEGGGREGSYGSVGAEGGSGKWKRGVAGRRKSSGAVWRGGRERSRGPKAAVVEDGGGCVLFGKVKDPIGIGGRSGAARGTHGGGDWVLGGW